MSLTLDAAPPVDWTMGGAAPRYATPRDYSAPSDGARIAKIARALGKPGLPWQRYVWDVATEHEPSGALRYEIVLVTVPRQSGKTTAYGPVQLDRCIMNPGIKTFYTAQTGKDARSRFNDLVELVGTSALKAITTFRFSAGDEAIRFPNGSQLKLFAPVLAALHGETPPLVGMDEIWELDEELGDAILEGAIIPAQMTLAGRRQIWLFSTAGTAASRFMKKWVDRGRAGNYPRMAYFEWSLPEGADPFDPDVIASFHPAVGFTVTVDELLDQARAVSLATWMRAYCNAWTEAADPLIPAEEWKAMHKPQLPVKRSEIAITYEVAPDYQSGDIMASWWDAAGRPNVRLLHHAPGTAWMLDLLVQLHAWKPAVLGADDGKPNRKLTDQLRRKLGDDAITTVPGRDFPTACDAFLGYAMEEKSLVHDGSRTLQRAIAGAVLNRTGEGVTISRTRSATPPGSLIAGAVGLWLAQHPPEDAGGNDVFDLDSVLGS